MSAQQPAQDRGTSERAAGPDTASEVQQPLLSQGSRHGGTAEAADKEGEAGDGGAEQALQEEQARVDAEGGEGGGTGRAAAEPLSWGTRIAQRLFTQVSADLCQGRAGLCARSCVLLHYMMLRLRQCWRH